MKLRLRLATIRDLTRITDIVIAGLPDDPTFDYLWRYRHAYPDDNYFFWFQKLKTDLFNPFYTFLVVEWTDMEEHVLDQKSPNSDTAGPVAVVPEGPITTVISFAVWERNGCSVAASKRFRARNTWLNYVQYSLTKIENWAVSLRYTRRDGDLVRLSNFLYVHGQVHQRYWTVMYPDNFHLVLICTHPDFRRRGAGTKLVKWGKMEAAKEGAIAGVEASPMGMRLYKKLGFEVADTLAVQKEGEEEFLPVPVMVCLNPGVGI